MKNKKYPIVALCGSTKFISYFKMAQTMLTLKGYITISVDIFSNEIGNNILKDLNAGELDDTSAMLNNIRKTKIDIADMLFVINPNGYINNSTWDAICYAREIGKPIESLEEISENKITDDIQDANIKTNRDWLNSLSDEDFVKWLLGQYPVVRTVGENNSKMILFDGYEKIKFNSTNSYICLIDFLKNIHEE